jgi:DNA-binding transcriptional ArsR family regulator
VPTPTAPSGGDGSTGSDDDDGPSGGSCGCDAPPEGSGGGGGDGGGGSSGSPAQQVARTVATVQETKDGAVGRAFDEVARRLPSGPSGPAPGVPSDAVLPVTVEPGEPSPEASPTARTAAGSEPAMPFAAKAAIATMAVAGIVVPLASAGGAAPLALHKLVGAMRRVLAWVLGLPLYAKLKREQVMTHPVRESIVGLVQAEPGIHAQRLRRELGLGWGTLAHHLRVLETWGLVALLRDGNKVKAFPSEWSPAERRRAAALASPGTSQVYQAITETPGAEQRQLAVTVGRSHPTVIWHAERLEKAGLIRVERRGRRTSYFPAVAPA